MSSLAFALKEYLVNVSPLPKSLLPHLYPPILFTLFDILLTIYILPLLKEKDIYHLIFFAHRENISLKYYNTHRTYLKVKIFSTIIL